MTSARILRLIGVASLLVLLDGPAASQDAAGYGCPMHPAQRATAEGTCPLCGMALLRMGPEGAAPYRVTVETAPREVRSGETVTLKFAIAHPTTGAPVRELAIVHEMPFHLFIVGDDLGTYDHIHPEPDGGGAFTVTTSFPRPGTYHLYCDFLPVGGTPQVAHLRVVTHETKARAARSPVRLTPDAVLTKVVDGIRFELKLAPPQVAAGKAFALIYRLSDAHTGVAVTDLTPYLGAWGHTLILSEDAERYVHCHPTRMLPEGVDPAGLSAGPEVAFGATLREPGVHRIWSQFKRGGKVTTVSFTIDVVTANHLAAWNGSRWSPLGGLAARGPDGPVRALAARGAELFAGGDFQSAGGASANGIARWDGRRWRPLASGVDGSVRAIAIAGSDVYVGGEFTSAGGVAANGIARWDGREWSALGAGVAGSRDPLRPAAVYALAVRGREVFVGGRFTTSGGVETNGIARWDGSRFTALGTGVGSGASDGIVWAMAFFRDGLYVGGQFTTAGSVAARNLARWDGGAFRPVGSGVAGGLERVAALAASGGRLFVGGDFTTAGELDAGQLAAWDGERWHAVAVRTGESVRAMTAGGATLYVAGGSFATATGVQTHGIITWDGNAWRPLGEGLGSGAFPAQVLAIAPAGRSVYIGGGPFSVR